MIELQQQKLDELERKNQRIEALERRFEKELKFDKDFEAMKAEIIKELSDPDRKYLYDPKYLDRVKPRKKDMLKDMGLNED